MSDLISGDVLTTLAQVVMIDLVLAGDNAVVIGLAAAGLPEKQRKRAILIGIVTATVLRIVGATVATQLRGMTLNGTALLRYLGDTPPKLEKARSVAEKMIAGGGALRALDGELKNQRGPIWKPELPPIMGQSGQLLQVIVNLIQNAIDAMDSVDSGRRVLQVRTEHDGGDAISITIEDTGPGIDPKNHTTYLVLSLRRSRMGWGWD
jgi:signal transduction histidine kinase